MQPLYMTVIGGEVTGLPRPKPQQINVAVDSGYAFVGCGHWNDALLAEYGIHRIDPACGFDPSWHDFTGGGTLEISGMVLPNFIDRDHGALRAELSQRIDSAAEAERQRYITPGSGQSMVYQEKIAEALEWDLAGAPEAGSEGFAANYPLIAAEIGVNGATAEEVVMLWRAMRLQWRAIAAAIEAVRLNAKAAIAAAESAAEMKAVMDGLSWPAPPVV